MKLEINMPAEFIKALYDILYQAMERKQTDRLDVVADLISDTSADSKKDKLTLIREWTEEITILDIATDILADELKKEGAL